jgi:hypothetical protein
MRILKPGTVYFALVFGAGFVLGSVRVPFLVPRFGVRLAELFEMPAMFVVILFAARYVLERFALPRSVPVRLGVGLVALCLLAAAELMFAFLLQGQPIGQYIASRDPVSGSVYAAMLVLFALMPLLLGRKRQH